MNKNKKHGFPKPQFYPRISRNTQCKYHFENRLDPTSIIDANGFGDWLDFWIRSETFRLEFVVMKGNRVESMPRLFFPINGRSSNDGLYGGCFAKSLDRRSG